MSVRRSTALVGLCVTLAAGIELCGVETGLLHTQRYVCTPVNDCTPDHVRLHYVSDSDGIGEDLGNCFIWRRDSEEACAFCPRSCCRILGRGVQTECVDYLTFFNFTEPREGIWMRETLGEVTFVVKSGDSRILDVYVEMSNFCATCNQIAYFGNDGVVKFFGLCSLGALNGSGCPSGEYWNNGSCSGPKKV